MALFLRLLSFARRYRWGLASAVLLVFVTTGLQMVPPYLTKLLIDNLGEFHKLDAAARESARADGLRIVVLVCGSLLAIRLTLAFIEYVRAMTLVFIGNRVVFDVRQQLYRHLQRLSLRYFEKHSTGRIMTRILYDVDAVQHTLTGNLVDIVTNSMTIVFVIGLIFTINYRLAAIGVAVLPLYVLNFLLWRPPIRKASTEAREQYSEISGRLHESIAGIQIIKAFTRERSETRRFVREVREIIDLNIKAGRFRTLLSILSPSSRVLPASWCSTWAAARWSSRPGCPWAS